MRGTFLSLLVLSCLGLPLRAQLPLGFGLKGGARLTDFTESRASVSRSDHAYTIGPYAELRLPWSLAVELDLLYKRSAATATGNAGNLVRSVTFNVDSFDVPILLKKSFDTQMIVRPYVEAGLANRYSSGIPGPVVPSPLANPLPAISVSSTSGWQEGIVLGAGVQFKIVKVKFSGELRWTRFGNISANTLPKLNANQAELLIGVGL